MKEPRALKLHQSLHGYADGHRQLALSAALKSRDQKTLLALSDISGPGARPGSEGYLTGYPLAESGLYALARTWSAPEMSRPGCVWTHTLLIDFTDLAGIEFLGNLERHFRRPTSTTQFTDYTKAQPVLLSSFPDDLRDAGSWGRQIVAALYGHPKKPIIAERPNSRADQAVLAIWSQQWPKLRRSFRFCTLSAADRSLDRTAFDLQLLPGGDRAIRSRFSRAHDAEFGVTTAPWLEDAWRDLESADADGLRSFFRQLGSDLVEGREAFSVLCRLHQLVKAFPTDAKSVETAIALLHSELSPAQARTARTIVAAAALESVGSLDDASFEFLWDHLPFLEPTAVASQAGRVGKAAWSRDPQLLAAGDPLTILIAEQTISELTASELLGGLARLPALSERAVRLRPELLGHPEFWLLDEDSAFGFGVATEQGQQASALGAMISARQARMARGAVEAFGAAEVLVALNKHGTSTSDDRRPWVDAACADVGATSSFLASTTNISRRLLIEVAHAVPPDCLPNVSGRDPWLAAWRESVGPSSHEETLFLAAYYLTRALGSVSASPAELARLSFEPVYTAAAVNDLPIQSWSMVEATLPWAPFWLEWDRCSRLRSAIVSLFLSRELEPSQFAALVSEKALFRQLGETVARSEKGRAYLKRVRRWMKESGGKVFKARSEILDELIG